MTWSTSPGLVAALWTGAVLATGWFALLVTSGGDPAGRVLAAVAAAGLFVAALFTTRARPRLQADADGLTVRGMVGSRHHPWPLVRRVRVVQIRRLGLRRSTLEIDAVTTDGAESLLVFGRFELAAEPEEVLADLSSLRAGP